MRTSAVPSLVLPLLLLAACAGDGTSRDTETAEAAPSGSAGSVVRGGLSRDVFPLDAPDGRFVTTQRGFVDVRLEPHAGGTAMYISGDGLETRRIDWLVEGDSVFCSDGPDRKVEFLRYGATRGTTWQSSGRVVRFDGWERIETPAGPYDAARVSSSLDIDTLSEVETWWFAPDVGLVQMRIEKAPLYTMEMKRVR